MSDERRKCSNRFSSRTATPFRSVAFTKASIFSLLLVVTSCAGCAFRFESAAGDTWSMGLSRHTVELRPLDYRTVLAKEKTQTAPFDLAVIPVGIEAALGWQQQARGFVLSNSATNRFLAPSGFGFGNVNGWYLGFVHYRIPRENNHVRLLVNSVKGGCLRVANADPNLKIGISKTTLTTVLDENVSGDVEYNFSPSVPDFNYSIHSITSH